MNTTKFFIGGIAGGIVYFLLGWLIYGMLLSNYMKSVVPGVDRGDAMVFWALIIGNLLMGFVLSYVLNRGGGASAGSGIKVGAVIGFLFSAGFDFVMYGTTNLITLHQLAADVVAFTVLSAIAGAVVGLVSKPRIVTTA
ncbi:MAG TPA: hypothetical protein VGI61_11205 [Parafilimonas sp.]|jgi:hypothetical protein